MGVTSSIVVLNWNVSDETIECLKSLDNQTNKEFEVLIVDNGSTKEELTKLKSFLKKARGYKIKLIENGENSGFCEGNNIGIRASSGEYVILLNNDTILDEKWHENLLEPFTDPSVGVTASKIIFYDGKENNIIQYAGGKLTSYGKPVYFGIGQKDEGQFDTEKKVFFAMGASFAIRRSVLKKLGEMFPKEYFIYFEEIDICWRIRSLGYDVVYCPGSVVYHKGSVSLKRHGQVGFRQDRLTFRNKYLTYYRNLWLGSFLFILPSMIAYDLMRCGKRLFMGELWFTKSYIYGFSDFLKTIKKIKRLAKGSLSQLSL